MPNFRITARAGISPVTMDQAREHLQLYGDTSYDTYLTSLLEVATEVASGIVGEPIESYTVQSWGNSIHGYEIPHQTVRSLTSVQYYNVANQLITVDPATYFLDLNRRRPTVYFNAGITPPNDFEGFREFPVSITYEAGLNGQFGADVEHAVLLIIGDLFQNRESTRESVSNQVYLTAETLLRRYRKVQW